MVILEVYSKCVKVKYKTCLCSKATFFTFLTIVVSIIIPFIFAYNSRGFWLKHDTFYEQPNVRFKGEYLFTAITSNVTSPVLCSNFPYFQSFANNFDRCSLIKARDVDNNKDGKSDELKFSLGAELDNFRILSFYLVLTLDYSLYTVCPMQMQSAIIVQHNFQSFSTSEINIDANLGLTQLSPLQCHPHRKDHLYNYSIIHSAYNWGYDIKNIILNYSKRNISTHLVNQYTTFTTGDADSTLLLNLKVRFPEHAFYYIPSFWQVIKWAWIQYFALYIIFAWVMQKVRNYVFENRLVLFYEMFPWKKIR